MFLDAKNLFSDNQELSTGSVASTNVISRAPGKGIAGKNLNTDLRVFVVCTNPEAAAGGTSVKFTLDGSKNGTSSWQTIFSSTTITDAELKKGYICPGLPLLLDNKYQYLRLNYTVTGTYAPAAKVTAGLLEDGVEVIDLSPTKA